jgi:hypothetical protein
MLVYWHLETNVVCIYSQLRNFSFSEFAAMVEGLIRHDAEMRVEKNFVDSHGQSEVALSSPGRHPLDAPFKAPQVRTALLARQGHGGCLPQPGRRLDPTDSLGSHHPTSGGPDDALGGPHGTARHSGKHSTGGGDAAAGREVTEGASEMEHAIRHEINSHLAEDPVFYRRLSECLEEIIQDRCQHRLEAIKAIRRLQVLAEEMRNVQKKAESLGLSPDGLALYNLLLDETHQAVRIT